MSNSISQHLGEYLSHHSNDSDITIQCTQGWLKITFYTPNVVRVWASQKMFPDYFSYAVVTSPKNTTLKIKDIGTHLSISSTSTILCIEKKTTTLQFLDAQEKLLNEDDPLGIRWVGEQISCYKKLQEGERFIGLGEKNGPLDKRGRGYINWNTDAFSYGPESDPLYCSIPFYIGVHHQKVYGLYFDNSYRTQFNFGASNNRFASFSADSGEMIYYFITGQSIAELIDSYTYLTGRPYLPPKWSLGYQQCRYSYYPDQKVLRIAENLREKDLPADAIVLDIHYMDEYKIFTWSEKKFPDPSRLIQQLKHLGFHVVLMCDPGIKVETGYEPYDSGKKENLFLKYPDGSNYCGEVWPGWCHFPDFTKETTRQWWSNQLKKYTAIGVDGFWNDMNEIATWGQMLPEIIEFEFEGKKSTSREGRNIYGLMMAKSTYEGTKQSLHKRPFNLTRAGFAGIQRYAAVWTGDNVAYDAHMMAGIRLVNSMGLSGLSFTGYDIGGFVGNADENLFARWLSIGSFSPFFRVHSMINTRDSEPWSYGERTEEISRNYIKLRYRLMPYIYSLFFEASQTGMPINRSLAFYYPYDDTIYNHLYHNQYLFGPSLLVAPAESNKELVKLYLPEGNWFELYTDKIHQGKQTMIVDCPIEYLPVYVRESSIIPMQQHAGKNTADIGNTLEIHLYNGKNKNDFTLYEDDGETFDYETERMAIRKIYFSPNEKMLIVQAQQGSYTSLFTQLIIYFHGFEEIKKADVNNLEQSVQQIEYRYLQPISHFDPFTKAHEGPKISLPSLATSYKSSEITIRW